MSVEKVLREQLTVRLEKKVYDYLTAVAKRWYSNKDRSTAYGMSQAFLSDAAKVQINGIYSSLRELKKRIPDPSKVVIEKWEKPIHKVDEEFNSLSLVSLMLGHQLLRY